MTGNDPDGDGKRTVRHYTPEYVDAYLHEMIDRYDFKSISFNDDTFNLGTKHVEGMCNVMDKVGLPWTAMCRADTIKLETWKRMYESGCVGVKLGFESGNQLVVDKIVNKHLNLEYGRTVVKHLEDLGMSVHGTFTYGLPGETPEQMRETQAYYASLPFDTFQVSGTAEIEGAPLHTSQEEEPGRGFCCHPRRRLHSRGGREQKVPTTPSPTSGRRELNATVGCEAEGPAASIPGTEKKSK